MSRPDLDVPFRFAGDPAPPYVKKDPPHQQGFLSWAARIFPGGRSVTTVQLQAGRAARRGPEAGYAAAGALRERERRTSASLDSDGPGEREEERVSRVVETTRKIVGVGLSEGASGPQAGTRAWSRIQ